MAASSNAHGGGFSAREWERFLSEELDQPVRVRFGRARQRVLVATPPADRAAPYDVRMNGFFADAPAEVRAAVASWLRSGKRARRACRVLDAWIDETIQRLPPPPPRAIELRPRGDVHDLEALADELYADALPPTVLPVERRPRPTWGHRARRRVRHTLRLGSCEIEAGLVRIHPVLDQPAVPAWFVRYVLFHELLHAAIPPRREGRRLLHHPPEFNAAERAYPDFERARAWQDQHLGALIRSTRTGKPMRAPAAAERAAPKPAGARRWIQQLLFDE